VFGYNNTDVGIITLRSTIVKGEGVSRVPLEDYLRVADAALELGVTTRRVRQLIAGGRLRAEPLTPRLYLVERESVERYKRTRRPPGRPARQRS
jgi:excisionase family DNA binding protein